jgi:eukaryotic-like serine/threonine-protein kinase
MKLCASCQNKYPDDANFCPREECATPDGPHRLTPIPPDASPATGAGRFVQISRLGGGASGEVWQASDSQTGGAVAYKLVTSEAVPTTVAIDRALRELRQLQRTSSPRIVKVIDFGKTPEGRLFVASELAEGEPLDQVVQRNGPFTLERAKRIVAQIGEALLDAQKVGVVHRDLSAKNVLVSGDDEVRIINFAVARPFADNVFGIPEFMSPEQAEGKLIDQRSNTYSVGALLYFMLTGQPPHVGATPQATIEAILKGDLTPPSIKRLGAGLTTEVDRVVLKALERSSSRRPLTLRQFLADVASLVVTQQTATNPAPGGEGKDPAFAKTMVFAGGAQEVQKLVAQAIAAREAAGPAAPAAPTAATTVGLGPTGLPATAPVASGRPSSGLPTGTPAPVARPPHGAAVAATVMAMPASGGKTPSPTQTGGPTPPIATVAQGGAAGAGATNFRETLWFKKGDVDQMVADARAKVAALAEAKNKEEKEKAAAEISASNPIVVPPTEEGKPLEDRYLDDGTLTADDRKNFSLRRDSGPNPASGRNATVPGERMSDTEVLDEIGGGKRVAIIGIVAAVLAALIAVVVVVVRGKGKGGPNKAATMATSPGAPLKAEPSPQPAVAPTPAPPAGKTEGVNGKESDTAAAPARPAATHKKVVVKKKPAPPPAKKHK